jgi:hypothetical protein
MNRFTSSVGAHTQAHESSSISTRFYVQPIIYSDKAAIIIWIVDEVTYFDDDDPVEHT